MSRSTMTFLAVIGILGAASAAQAALPDAGLPRMVSGGLRQMVAAMEQKDPRLPLELKRHVTSADGDPLVRVNLADGVTPEQALPQLRAAGFRLQAVSSINRSFIEGYISLANVKQLAATSGIRSMHAVHRPVAHAGIAQSQAVARQNVDAVLARGVTGKGIRVGVMSDSYDACGDNCLTIAADDIASGDLPAEGVTVLTDLGPADGGEDEGRGMLQLVHDIAPDAKLGFASAFIGEVEFSEGMLALRNEFHADVVVDDVVYFDEPMFSDGLLAQTVDHIKRSGGAYFSSAGNNGLEAFEDVYSPISFSQAKRLVAGGKSNIKLDQIPADIRPTTLHQFSNGYGSTSITQRITTATDNVFALQWDEPFNLGKVQTDYNVYVFDKDGNWMDPASPAFPGFYTTDSNVDTDQPFEFLELLPFAGELHGGANTSDYQIVIGKVGNGPARHFKYVTVNGLAESERSAAPSTWGHAAARGGQGVAAIYYPDADFPEDYSSPGPTTIYLDKDGNRLPRPDVRFTPQITAVDGADTTFFGFDSDGNGFPNFFGTSAAAPDAAGVAALMLQAAGGPGSLSPERLYAKLQQTATGIPLPDNRNWSGALTGPVSLLVHGDWSRWNHFFNLQMSPFINRKVQSISFDATNTTVIWSTNPARFHTTDLVGIAAGDMTVAITPDQEVFTINFAPGSFGKGDSIDFGMSLFTALESSTQITPDRLRDMKVTVTLEGGQTFTSTVIAGIKFPINRFTGFGLVNADAAVKAVKRRSGY
jgi:Subtilase family